MDRKLLVAAGAMAGFLGSSLLGGGWGALPRRDRSWARPAEIRPANKWDQKRLRLKRAVARRRARNAAARRSRRINRSR